MSSSKSIAATALVVPSVAQTQAPSVLIDNARLNAYLGEARHRFSITALAECPSTSTLLLACSAQGAPSGSVIVCDRQTAGRGSRGRRWSASPQASLTFSLLWHFTCEQAQLSGLSLGVGLAVVRALDDCGARGAMLKWPNDVLYHDAKLAGILIELCGDPVRAQAVIGIGLNLLPPDADKTGKPDGGAEAFMMPATSVDAMVSPAPERNLLLAAILKALAAMLDRFAQTGFAGLRDEWLARHAWQTRPVRVLRDGRVVAEGLCCGVDVDGTLLVQTPAGVIRCLSGDVSLRAAS